MNSIVVCLAGALTLLPMPRKIEVTGPAVSSGGLRVETVLTDSIAGAREMLLDGFPAEAYTLSVTPERIRIEAVTERGFIRARNTLDQLREAAGGDSLPQVEITDWPAFPLRGFMHDTGRSYIPVEHIKRHIDMLSRYKINTFHWHLTENQAWRFDSKAYPQLTSPESMTRHHGGSYTPEECREVEAYAAERGVTVIPEIDMPGHSAAFKRAMGFDMQSDEGVEVLTTVLGEVAEAFPLAPYIHIGGDEVPIRRGGFLRQMTDRVRELGRKAIVWNPIHGTAINDTVGADMTQMWGTAGRLVPGLPNIDCRYMYANHFDPYADIAAIYRSNIYYQPEATPETPGSIVAFWNDRRLPDTEAIVRDNSFYPAALALAERTWIGGGEGYIETVGTVLPTEGPGLEEFADWERRFVYHRDHTLADEPIAYSPHSDIRWQISAPATIGEPADTTQWKDVAGGTVYLRHVWGRIIPGVYTDAKPGCYVLARTRVWSDCDTVRGFYVETQNYSRSERDQVPPQGQWDFRGSEIRVNGELLAPPVWDNSGLLIDNEELLLNENATARPLTQVPLRRGWNTVEAYLPYVDAPGVRLDKWMITFVPGDR